MRALTPTGAAFEANGIGTWKSSQSTVPVTLMREKFRLPNVSTSGLKHTLNEGGVMQLVGGQNTAIPAERQWFLS